MATMTTKREFLKTYAKKDEYLTVLKRNNGMYGAADKDYAGVLNRRFSRYGDAAISYKTLQHFRDEVWGIKLQNRSRKSSGPKTPRSHVVPHPNVARKINVVPVKNVKLKATPIKEEPKSVLPTKPAASLPEGFSILQSLIGKEGKEKVMKWLSIFE